MTSRRPRRPSPALLISILALVMAMGGSSIAQDVVADISAKIKGNRIAKNAIKSKHIANGKVKAVDLAPGVIPDAYSKTESDGKYQASGNYLAASGKAADSELLDGKDSTEFLGKTEKAADSEALDGVDSSGFVRGGGAFSSATRSVAEGNATTLLDIPGMPELRAGCSDVAGFSNATVTLLPPAGSTTFTEAYMNDNFDNGNNDGAPEIDVRIPFNSGSAALTTSAIPAREVSFNVTRRAASLFASTTITDYRVLKVGVSGANNCRFSVHALTRTFGGITAIGPITVLP